MEIQKKIAKADEIQYDKFYVIDFINIKIGKDKIIKNNKNINKIPVTFLIDSKKEIIFYRNKKG